MASLVTVGTCKSCFSLLLFSISEMLTSGVTRCLTQSSSGGARQAQSGSEKMVPVVFLVVAPWCAEKGLEIYALRSEALLRARWGHGSPG